MRRYDTVIVGSGFYSFGYAAAHPKTLIVEETHLADRHFSGCLRGFSCAGASLNAPMAKALAAYMREHGIVRGDQICVPALEAGLCAFFADRAFDVLLGTTCMDIETSGEEYRLSLCNNEGLSNVAAKRVIDTRVCGGDVMNVLVQGGIDNIIQGISVGDAFYNDQKILSLHFENGVDINRAKEEAYPRLRDLLTPTGATVLQMAYRMYSTEPAAPFTDDKDILRIDESFFGDPFIAFEKGELQK